MELQVLNNQGKKTSTIKVDEAIFGLTPNKDAVHRSVLSEMANSRQGTHSTKSRGMVRGGGKTPWKQKGRGVARAGTIRSPLWKGGGAVFGPEPHGYNNKLPKRISRLARCSVLSSKVAEGNLLVVEDFSIDSHKTSEFISILEHLELKNKKLTLLLSEHNDNLDKSVRNLKNVHIVDSKKASTYDLIDCDVLVMDKASIKILTDILTD